MIILDGNHGEGGGQIIRTALAFSMLTQQPFKAINIRAQRKDPGLKAQHITCIKALQQLSASKVDGAELGSKELLFIPGPIKAKNVSIDIGTAGSITLLLQAVLLQCMFADKTHTLTIQGGTDVSWSMPTDYFKHVILPQYGRVCNIQANLVKRGYYPKGGGVVELKIKPEIKRNSFEKFNAFQAALKHKNFTLGKQGQLSIIKGTSHASKSLENRQVAERQAASAKQQLTSLGVPIDISIEYQDTLSTGSGITLWAIFAQNGEVILENPVRLGADALGEPSKTAETVGIEAARKLISEINSKAPVDSHAADNLIPLLALCKPSMITVSKITAHTKTNMWVIEQFIGKTFTEEENVISS